MSKSPWVCPRCQSVLSPDVVEHRCTMRPQQSGQHKPSLPADAVGLRPRLDKMQDPADFVAAWSAILYATEFSMAIPRERYKEASSLLSEYFHIDE